MNHVTKNSENCKTNSETQIIMAHISPFFGGIGEIFNRLSFDTKFKVANICYKYVVSSTCI